MPRPIASSEVWDVIKVPFPYADRPAQQHRPALVVARHEQPGSPALLWVMMITSATHQRWSDDIAVSDLLMAGLPAASIVRVAKIATIEARDAERIGCLSVADRPAVRAQIAVLLTDALGEQA